MSGDAARPSFQPQCALMSAQRPIGGWFGHHQRAGLASHPATRQCERTLTSRLLSGSDVEHDARSAFETRRMLQGSDDESGNAALHV